MPEDILHLYRSWFKTLVFGYFHAMGVPQIIQVMDDQTLVLKSIAPWGFPILRSTHIVNIPHDIPLYIYIVLQNILLQYIPRSFPILTIYCYNLPRLPTA